MGDAAAIAAIVDAARESDDPAILVAASVLARDHLVDHPDSVLAAWIAGVSHRHTSDRERP